MVFLVHYDWRATLRHELLADIGYLALGGRRGMHAKRSREQQQKPMGKRKTRTIENRARRSRMLVITRREGESFFVGKDIEIVILQIGATARIGINAPREIQVLRTELIRQPAAVKKDDNR